MTKFGSSNCSFFTFLSGPSLSLSRSRWKLFKDVETKDDIAAAVRAKLELCHFNFSYEFDGERFRSISWLMGGCTLVCGILLSGVFQEGGRPPPGPEKGPEGSSRGGPGCPTPEGSYWVFSNRVISLSSSSPNSPPIREGSPTTITSWKTKRLIMIKTASFLLLLSDFHFSFTLKDYFTLQAQK